VGGSSTATSSAPSPALLDSGANGHFLKDERRFNTKPTPVHKQAMTSASGNECTIKARGDAGRLRDAHLVDGLTTEMVSIGQLYDDTKRYTTFGPDVWQHDQDPSQLPGAVRIGARTSNGLYIADERWLMNDEPQYLGALGDILPKDNILLIHARLGHVSYRTIAHAISSGIVKGIRVTKAEMEQLRQNKGPLCLACGLGKTIKRKLMKDMSDMHVTKPTKPFQILFIDTCGPVKPPSKFGDTNFIIVVDAYTNDIWTIPIRARAYTAQALDDFLGDVASGYETDLEYIMTIRTDGAKELTQGKITEVYKKWGLRMKETTSPYSSYQNANAERAIRTTVTMATAMMLHAGAPNHEWIYALRAATYTLRRLPTTANPDRKAPIQMMLNTNEHVNLAHLRTWYSPVFVKKQEPEITKSRRFGGRGWPGTFLGYQEGVKGYVVRIHGQIYTRSPRDVYFVEDMKEAKKMLQELQTEQTKTTIPDTQTIFVETRVNRNDDKAEDSETETRHTAEFHEETETTRPNEETSAEHKQEDKETERKQDEETEHKHEQTIRTSTRTRKPRVPHNIGGTQSQIEEKLGFSLTDLLGYAGTTTNMPIVSRNYVPNSYNKALACEDALKWQKAINDEFLNMANHEVFEIVDRPSYVQNVIRPKHLFKIKMDGRFKCRLVAMGFTQKEGIDYNEVFSPCVRTASVRLFSSLVVQKGLLLTAFDISAAFLYGDWSEEFKDKMFLRMPEGYESFLENYPQYLPPDFQAYKDQRPSSLPLAECIAEFLQGKIIKLKHTLYGTKQAGRRWNIKLNQSLVEKIGFVQSVLDPCLYFRRNAQGVSILLIHVDDGMMASTTSDINEEVLRLLKEEYELHDCGVPERFLGMDVSYDAKQQRLAFTSESYINTLADRFNLTDTNGRDTPCNEKLLPLRNAIALRAESKDEETWDEKKEAMCIPIHPDTPYRAAVGSLMFLSITTRPDISFSVNQAARFVTAPSMAHWRAVKRILMYVIGTKQLGLVFQGGKQHTLQLTAFSDSDWGGELAEGRSTSGKLIMLNGCVIDWASKLQRTDAKSSAEAEYVAAALTAQSVVYLKQLLEEIGFPLDATPALKVDNEACIKCAKNPVYHGRMKHLHISYHFLRQHEALGSYKIGHIDGKWNPADHFTKPLQGELFERHRKKIVQASNPSQETLD